LHTISIDTCSALAIISKAMKAEEKMRKSGGFDETRFLEELRQRVSYKEFSVIRESQELKAYVRGQSN